MSAPEALKVGVYVDGYNLYYGGRNIMGGRGQKGWKWLDVRQLAEALVRTRSGWNGAQVTRVVYCTAPMDGADNPTGARNQNVYLRALRASNSVDEIQMGRYINKIISRPLAVRGPSGAPVLARAAWPVTVQDTQGQPVVDARFMVSVAHREEKGTDVNGLLAGLSG